MLAVDPVDPETLFAQFRGVQQFTGLFGSQDGIGTSLPSNDPDLGRLADALQLIMAIDPTRPSVQYAGSRQINTGLALANLEGRPLSVELDLMTPQRSLLARSSFQLPAGGIWPV